MSFDQLAPKIAKRNEKAFEELYEKLRRLVYSVCLGVVKNRGAAEELTQETFYQAIRRIDYFNAESKVSTWLCGIAKNLFYAYLRKHPPTEILDENSTLCKSAESEVMSSLDKMDLLKQIHLLKEPGREVIHLRLYGNLSYAEIGEIMGKSENWARVTFYRAKEQLRKELQIDK